MEEVEEVMKVFESSLSLIKWRLRPSSKRRLETDILALWTGMRAVIMVDYGGKMPELQERLCAFLKISQKESSIFEHLRVMVIEDMIYLIHVKGIVELVKSSLNSETELNFVDIEQDPPKMITQAEESSIGTQLMSVMKLFSLVFPGDAVKNDLVQSNRTDSIANAESSVGEFIDLSSCMQDTEVTVPTLNGWLLGYPVVYLFGKEHIADAIYNLSTKSLHLFKISVSRSGISDRGSRQEELMSFTVPYELSIKGSDEAWAESFVARLQAKRESCKHIWGSLKMECSVFVVVLWQLRHNYEPLLCLMAMIVLGCLTVPMDRSLMLLLFCLWTLLLFQFGLQQILCDPWLLSYTPRICLTNIIGAVHWWSRLMRLLTINRCVHMITPYFVNWFSLRIRIRGGS